MDDAGIYARSIPGLERPVQVGVAGGRVISVSFPRDPDSGAGDDHPILDRIEAYAAGETETFEDVAVVLTVPTGTRAVLEALRDVPHGETVTVETLTGMTPRLDPEDADDRETVRGALTENPAPLLIPDHRVTDGRSAAPAEVVTRLREIEGITGER
jgi:methylated-DNA-[protein]-cysteine S-methyltransferase